MVKRIAGVVAFPRARPRRGRSRRPGQRPHKTTDRGTRCPLIEEAASDEAGGNYVYDLKHTLTPFVLRISYFRLLLLGNICNRVTREMFCTFCVNKALAEAPPGSCCILAISDTKSRSNHNFPF